MVYRPTLAPPVPSEQQELAQWVRQELQALQRELEAAGMMRLVELHAVPEKLTAGLTVLADGTNWNPGSGAGVYTYYGGSWHKLG